MGYVRNKYTENLDIEQYVLQKYVYNAFIVPPQPPKANSRNNNPENETTVP